MSVQALGWVFDHSPTTGTDRLVLLAIANHCGAVPTDEAGVEAWEAWPGIALIAREAGLARQRTVTDALGRLVEGGHILRVRNGAPDSRMRGDRRPNLYRIPLDNGVSCGVTRCQWCGVTPSAPRGDASRHHGVTRGDTNGVTSRVTQTVEREPSVEPNPEPAQPSLLPVAPEGARGGAAKGKGKTDQEIALAQRARAVVDAVWERRDPKPATPYIAAVKIAERLLSAGHLQKPVYEAMMGAPTLTVAAVEFQLNRGRAAPVPSGNERQGVMTDRAAEGGRWRPGGQR